jgi:hypothetical protein
VRFDGEEARGRQITIMIATAIEAALLVRHSSAEVADAYVHAVRGSTEPRVRQPAPRCEHGPSSKAAVVRRVALLPAHARRIGRWPALIRGTGRATGGRRMFQG